MQFSTDRAPERWLAITDRAARLCSDLKHCYTNPAATSSLRSLASSREFVQSFIIAQNPQLVPAAARSPEFVDDAVVAQTVGHSTVMAVAARTLAHAVAAQGAIVAAMAAAAACALALMGNHDNYTEWKTVHYFNLHAVSIVPRCAALPAACPFW